MAKTVTREGHLAFGFNRRLVQAIEHLKTRKENPIDRNEVLDKIREPGDTEGYSPQSYNAVKNGQRSFPNRLESEAAYVLMDYGINPAWLVTGIGKMETPIDQVNEDMLLIGLLREEIAKKDKYIKQLEKELQQLKERLKKGGTLPKT